MNAEPLKSPEEIDGFLSVHGAWELREKSLTRSVTATTFMAGIELVADVAAVAESLDHHPDIDIRWRTVTFTVSTHSAGGITRLDFDLIEKIDDLVPLHS